MHLSASTAGWIAVGAAAVALLALIVLVGYYLTLRRVRHAQLVLLGDGKGRDDLVDFAVSLQGRIDALHRTVDELRTALSGVHQSASVALLDASRSGVVLSAIQGRDYARIYVKELDRGHASVALSPEELEAVERAMST